MRASAFFLLGLVSAVVADNFPYFQSVEFDQGKFGPYPNRSYVATPQLIAPTLNFLQSSPQCDNGTYTMVCLRGDRIPTTAKSPMILDDKGQLVWMNASYGETFALGVQKYNGSDYLTFWKGNPAVGGHGEGYYYMLDHEYKERYRISAGNGIPGDLHEFRITPEGTALVTLYPAKQATMSWRVRGGKNGFPNRKGWIFDSTVREIDIATDKVIFEWNASDHYEPTESQMPAGMAGARKNDGYDFFHINSIDKDYRGNYLVSARYMHGLTYINGTDGSIIWILGGKRNSFTDLSNGTATSFAYQHDGRWNPEHTGVNIFDNGEHFGTPSAYEGSRAVEILLDEEKMTAQLKRSFVNPRKIRSGSQGNMQVLPNGNVLVGYGLNAAWTEYAADGNVLCDVHIGAESDFNTIAVETYRVNKFPWVGRPTTPPDIAFKDGHVYVSWNGATEVKKWVLQASKGAGRNLKVIQQAEKDGFETAIPVNNTNWCFVKAVALDSKSRKLGVSKLIETGCVLDEVEEQPEDNELPEELPAEEVEIDNDVLDMSYWMNDRILFSLSLWKTLELLGIVGASIGMWELRHSRVLRKMYYVSVRKMWGT
ncbi:hypothetical protein BP5796_12601 [Coleophoma crateriformis]|uniref:ASST-domain-containing protein n=1 Tax=Coleophoma crateriformis TaxID=565419 RepID=A0A3D8Q809_9HELO|nr:hypothetical protein BP5796_12601 [Coleophoma crateriformis]